MLAIQPEAWAVMVAHAEQTYPRECCGVFLGRGADVTRAVPLDNVYEGPQGDRFEVRPADLVKVERDARPAGLEVLGIYHSHPDCDAYFSQTDLENSCPWYKNIVLSIRQGRFHHAGAFEVDDGQTAATQIPLQTP